MDTERNDLPPFHDATLPSTELTAPEAAVPLEPLEPPLLRRILFGRDGLRAGWSLLIFIALMAGMLWASNFITHKIHPPAASHSKDVVVMSARLALLNEAIPFLLTVLATWIMSKIERRPNSVYGLGGSRKLPHFLAGLGWGIAWLSLLIFLLWKTGLLVIERRLLFGVDALRWGAVWLLGFLLVGLLEEYLTRGYLQYTLTRGLAGMYRWLLKTPHNVALGFWTSAVLFSVLFGLGHSGNPGESPIGLLSAGLAALVFCLSLWRTGSLWWAIGFHTSWDWGQSFLYGVADSGTWVQNRLLATHPVGKPLLSGGTTGPEGSIFIIAVLAVVAVIIFVTLPQVEHREAAADLVA